MKQNPSTVTGLTTTGTLTSQATESDAIAWLLNSLNGTPYLNGVKNIAINNDSNLASTQLVTNNIKVIMAIYSINFKVLQTMDVLMTDVLWSI